MEIDITCSEGIRHEVTVLNLLSACTILSSVPQHHSLWVTFYYVSPAGPGTQTTDAPWHPSLLAILLTGAQGCLLVLSSQLPAWCRYSHTHKADSFRCCNLTMTGNWRQRHTFIATM